MSWLRDPRWLNQERVTAYSALTLLGYSVPIVYVIATTHGLLDHWGRPIGWDFLCFWAAGALALKGHAAGAYDVVLHAAEQAKVVTAAPGFYFQWFYPPVLLLPLALLAALPYVPALLVWLGGTALGYAAALRRIAGHRQAPLVAIAWPGFFDNVLCGQTGFLSASLLGGGLSFIETRPLLAGALLGGLCFKPQLAVLVPVALIAGRHWRVLAGMAASVATLCLAATLFFGAEIWTAYQQASQFSLQILESPEGAFPVKVSVFSTVRILGFGVAAAWIVQWAVSIGSALTVAWAWRKEASFRLKAALLAALTPLAAPWLTTYDLVMLAVPAAFLIREARDTGFRDWECAAMAMIWILPLSAVAVAAAFKLQIAPIVELALAILIVRRMALPGAATRSEPVLAPR